MFSCAQACTGLTSAACVLAVAKQGDVMSTSSGYDYKTQACSPVLKLLLNHKILSCLSS